MPGNHSIFAKILATLAGVACLIFMTILVSCGDNQRTQILPGKSGGGNEDKLGKLSKQQQIDLQAYIAVSSTAELQRLAQNIFNFSSAKQDATLCQNRFAGQRTNRVEWVAKCEFGKKGYTYKLRGHEDYRLRKNSDEVVEWTANSQPKGLEIIYGSNDKNKLNITRLELSLYSPQVVELTNKELVDVYRYEFFINMERNANIKKKDSDLYVSWNIYSKGELAVLRSDTSKMVLLKWASSPVFSLNSEVSTLSRMEAQYSFEVPLTLESFNHESSCAPLNGTIEGEFAVDNTEPEKVSYISSVDGFGRNSKLENWRSCDNKSMQGIGFYENFLQFILNYKVPKVTGKSLINSQLKTRPAKPEAPAPTPDPPVDESQIDVDGL